MYNYKFNKTSYNFFNRHARKLILNLYLDIL